MPIKRRSGGSTITFRGKDACESVMAALTRAKPSEARPDDCRKFVDWLHRYRHESGVSPVSDEVAVKAFDLIENFLIDWTRK